MFFDVIILGAGAAGLFCAAEAGARGRRVLLLDHASRLGERIRISGGGRCNFSNRDVSAENYLSQNPHFCRSALARFTPADFIARLERRGIPWREREHGRLFCERTAQDVTDMLLDACETAGVERIHPCVVDSVARRSGAAGVRFEVVTDRGRWRCAALVVATGGVAVPKLGASPFGYRLAEQFGIAVVPPKAALVPLALPPDVLSALKPLSGVSVAAETHLQGHRRVPGGRFREDVLVTHRGLSGPAILQISSYWQMQDYAAGPRRPLRIDLLPDTDAHEWLQAQVRSKALLANVLAERLPRRFAHEWCALHGFTKPLNELARRDLIAVAQALNGWEIMPSGTLGYAKAEVTLGGVDTRALSSQNLEAKAVPGLFFIGEVVDVTGWLGGYNFQWAWASGWAAGQAV
ncbi:NAD(P)/FAD-dependent oxidoreductase [Acidihalobacter ferrooxydans]|uniref:NAD(P)/FAD-dependent oxidoreductase n=1 Tax=Acidihalobacter ferrooxydans TaxID=1765967 RepID=UPI0009FA9D47|nr:NAD(P)/FAD-dependent oxidoreductase [Acidihalobacter ferrooxydans]